jgi:uncharacterized protein YrrD
MSKRASDVIGKPIVSADSGKKLGTVGDLLLDDHGRELLGLVVRHGALRREDVLPVEAVQSLGADAVVSKSDILVDAREWRDRQLRVEPELDRTPDQPTAHHLRPITSEKIE